MTVTNYERKTKRMNLNGKKRDIAHEEQGLRRKHDYRRQATESILKRVHEFLGRVVRDCQDDEMSVEASNLADEVWNVLIRGPERGPRPDAKTVTMEVEKRCTFTLRSLLPQIRGEVELVVEDAFDNGRDCDLYRLKAKSGNSLLRKLSRSRVVEGEALLDLTPGVALVSPQPTMLNGTFGTLTGTGFIRLFVTPTALDEED